MTAQAPPTRKRLAFLRGWRPFSYVLLIINVLFLIWVLVAPITVGDVTHCGGQPSCHAIRDLVGGGVGFGIVMFLWIPADIFLGFLWLVTSPSTPTCPSCDHNVKRRQVACRSCGYDLRSPRLPRMAPRPASRPAPPSL